MNLVRHGRFIRYVSIMLIVCIFYDYTSTDLLLSQHPTVSRESSLRPYASAIEPSFKAPPFSYKTDISINEKVRLTVGDKGLLAAMLQQGYYQFDSSVNGEFLNVEILRSRNNEVLYFVLPKFKPEDIWRDRFWHARKEMAALFPSLNPDEIMGVLTECNRIILGPNATKVDVFRRFSRNTLKHILPIAEDFYTGAALYDHKANSLENPNYSHVKLFSSIYANEAKVVKQLLELTDTEVSVLDVGTGHGDMIFTCDHLLGEEERNRVAYIGIDKKWQDMSNAREYSEEMKVNVSLAQVDILKSGWMKSVSEIAGKDKVDIIIANHVLEHLPGNIYERISECASLANDVLIISVPLDDEIDESISKHMHKFTTADLVDMSETLVLMSNGLFLIDTSLSETGILVIYPEGSRLLSNRQKAICRFSLASVQDIEKVYTSTWGKDSLRVKDQKIAGLQVEAEEIFAALNRIYETDSIGRKVAERLADSLRYSYGTCSLDGLMKPVSASMAEAVANEWRNLYERFYSIAGQEFCDRFGGLVDVWVEYLLYYNFRHQAQALTKRDDVDTFDGLGYSVGSPEEERILRERAFEEYEKADLVAFGIINRLMRVQPHEIADLIADGRFEELASLSAEARIFGEGRFHYAQEIYLSKLPDEFRQIFKRQTDCYINIIEGNFHDAKDISSNGLAAAMEAKAVTDAYLSSHNIKVPEFNYHKEEILHRQERMGIGLGESHLEKVEEAYSSAANIIIQDEILPEKYYETAMANFLDGLTALSNGSISLDILLSNFRKGLILARKSADKVYGNTFYMWRGYGESPVQMRLRFQNKRVKLYGLEAYAERMFLAAEIAFAQGDIAGNSMDAYRRVFETHPACIFVQEWIQNFNSRRAQIFGYRLLDDSGINGDIIFEDLLVHELIASAHHHGGSPMMWGWLYIGVADKLRSIIHALGKEHPIVINIGELIAADKIEDAELLILNTNPYDDESAILPGSIPAVTTAIHVCNVDMVTVNETLSHAALIDWESERRWTLLATSSFNSAIAEAERELCLRLGVTRYSLDARRHLKAGNQNRAIPNAPSIDGSESFYFTLDDDYCSASQVLHRNIPTLLDKKDIGYIQLPLYFRASNEPGFSLARRLDAVFMYSFMELFAPALNHSRQALKRGESNGFPLIFGTNTIFRTTEGRNYLADTGYFPVDRPAEDILQSYYSQVKRNTDLLTPATQNISSGIMPDELWIIGDGVDFLGKFKQLIRWSEGGTYVFINIWIWHIIKRLFRGNSPVARESKTPGKNSRFSIWQFIVATYIPSHYLLALTFGIFLFVLSPVEIFVAGIPLSLSLTIAAFIYACAPTIFYLYAHRMIGISIKEFFGNLLMVFFLSFPSYIISTYKTIFQPSRIWEAHKGSKSRMPGEINLLYISLAALNITAGLYGLYVGHYTAAITLLIGIGFLSLFGMQKPSPDEQRDKIKAMVRQVHRMPHRKSAERPFLKIPLMHGAALTNIALFSVGFAIAVFYYMSTGLCAAILLLPPFLMSYLMALFTFYMLIHGNTMRDEYRREGRQSLSDYVAEGNTSGNVHRLPQALTLNGATIDIILDASVLLVYDLPDSSILDSDDEPAKPYSIMPVVQINFSASA